MSLSINDIAVPEYQALEARYQQQLAAKEREMNDLVEKYEHDLSRFKVKSADFLWFG